MESDNELIRRILHGEQKAFRILVERHKGRAFTLALRMLKNSEDAEEALQDAFVRVFRALAQFELRSSFPTWFYRIVYNTCLTKLGRNGRDLPASIDDEAGGVLEASSSDLPPDSAFESQETQRIVGEEIQRLSPNYASVLTLFFLQEMTYEEICTATALPLATVKVRLFRGRMQLREALRKRLASDHEQNAARHVKEGVL